MRSMKVQVIGAGSWGLALARVLAVNGHDVRLWAREEDNPDELRETRESKAYLPGVLLPETIEVSREVDPKTDMAVFAVPSHAMRSVARAHPVSARAIRVSVAKGIENDSLMRMSEVIDAAAPGGSGAGARGEVAQRRTRRVGGAGVRVAAHGRTTLGTGAAGHHWTAHHSTGRSEGLVLVGGTA